MYISHLGAVATLAGLSQAFLIPPEISSSDIETITILPFEDAVRMDGRVLEITCPGCPVLTNVNGKVYSVEAESTLQLNFSLSHDNGADQLLLNGEQIYPFDASQGVVHHPLTAPQMMKSSDETWKYASNPRLGYSLAIGGSAGAPEDDLHLVAVHLEIVEVADRFVTGVPVIDLQLLETPSGKLMIGKSGVSRPAISQDGAPECTTLLCRWRAIVADRVAALKKGCGSKRPTPQVRPVYEPKPHYKHPEHAHSRPHGSHRPWRHHHRQGTVTRLLRGIVLHVLVPVLIGVMVGITASLIGMVVGQIVIFTWRMLFRSGQANYDAVNQVEETDESKAFLASQGSPPQYEIVSDEKKEIL